LNNLIKRIDETERSPANLLAADWPRRYIDRTSFANDCRSLLQPVEDTLSPSLTNVFGATRALSYLRVLL